MKVRSVLLALAVTLAGCGYGFSERYVARDGEDRIHVRAFRNRSGEQDLGAVVTAALRSELARRGAEAGEGAGAALEGEVRSTEPTITSTAATTWTVAVEVRARLVAGSKAPVERTARVETVFLGGADPLETEGRRALALRRAAEGAARELLRAFER